MNAIFAWKKNRKQRVVILVCTVTYVKIALLNTTKLNAPFVGQKMDLQWLKWSAMIFLNMQWNCGAAAD